MNTEEAITLATRHLSGHIGRSFDVFTIAKPATMEAAVDLAKIVSKLSPLVGNLIELSVVELLNDEPAFKTLGRWKRQDPEFPDALFEGKITPPPGFEIKAWFPLATEITARFKDSQNRFAGNNIHVTMLAWLPENVLYGRPALIDVCVVSGHSVAKARDDHYHNPPDYLVLEPEDTTARTRNLQQTNTNGYKWQGTAKEFEEAKEIVSSWGADGRMYKPDAAYQTLLHGLVGKYRYRLDTNYAKMDRIEHDGIEEFKTRTLTRTVCDLTVGEWACLLAGPEEEMAEAFEKRLGIKDGASL